MNDKVKCIRKDGSVLWLNEKLAHNINRQRQMGYYPEEAPEEEEIVLEPETVEEPVEEVVEETTEDTVELEDIGTDGEKASDESPAEETEETKDEEPAVEEAPEEEATEEVADETPKTLEEMNEDELRQAYKDKFEKFPSKKWKQATIIKKING